MKIILISLVTLLAIVAAAYGLIMVNSPEGGMLGITPELLHGSGFRDFFIPGLLLTVTAFANIIALFFLIQSHKHQFSWSVTGAALFICCMLASIILVQSHYWFQPILMGAGVIVILLSIQLRGKWAV